MCTLIGAESGVFLRFSSVTSKYAREPLTIDACADTDCEHLEATKGRRVGAIHVGKESVSDGSPVRVELTIRRSDGSEVFHGTTVVTPRNFQPNGPNCAPSVWTAAVEAEGTSRLVVATD